MVGALLFSFSAFRLPSETVQMLTEVFTGEVNIFSASKNPHSDAYNSTTTVSPLSFSLSLFLSLSFGCLHSSCLLLLSWDGEEMWRGGWRVLDGEADAIKNDNDDDDGDGCCCCGGCCCCFIHGLTVYMFRLTGVT